ncbi:unnamed protein product [Prunus armeniaca]|uniref:Uncharacterized protein n=1 Tax=Prunus armeniaca TaxID=36596 RepID=A0A6J5X8Y3_PRUAR|nr:unnamed protein product [Prunus armeniaca]
MEQPRITVVFLRPGGKKPWRKSQRLLVLCAKSRLIQPKMILTTLVHHAMDQASHNLSPCKASRIQSLKIRFSDTILKANKIIKGPPDSPPSRKLMQRTKERESARRTILNMEKSVYFEDHL